MYWGYILQYLLFKIIFFKKKFIFYNNTSKQSKTIKKINLKQKKSKIFKCIFLTQKQIFF